MRAFADDRHALYCGWVMGAAMRAGLSVVPVVDGEGNYLPELVVHVVGLDIRLVIPEPPAEWVPLVDELAVEG